MTEKAEVWAFDLRDVFKELEKEVMENLSKIRAAMSTTITQASTSTPTSLAQREDCTRRHTQLADSGQSTDGSPRGPVDVSIPAGNNQPTDTSRINHLVVNDVTRASVAPITVASATLPVASVGMSQRDWIREGVQTRDIDRTSQCNNDARIGLIPKPQVPPFEGGKKGII